MDNSENSSWAMKWPVRLTQSLCIISIPRWDITLSLYSVILFILLILLLIIFVIFNLVKKKKLLDKKIIIVLILIVLSVATYIFTAGYYPKYYLRQYNLQHPEIQNLNMDCK